MWVKKRTKTKSLRVHKLDFTALNVCFWVTWHSLGEKIFKSITICENCLASEILVCILYPYVRQSKLLNMKQKVVDENSIGWIVRASVKQNWKSAV